MTRRILTAVGTIVFLVGLAAPARATVSNIWGPPGELCTVSRPCSGSFTYPLRQGAATTLDIEGQFVDLSTGVEISGSGVSISTVGTSSSHRKLRFSVSADATPGGRTVTLHYAVELNGPDRFQVMVLRAGKVTNVTAPSPTAYFNDVDVTFQGDNLDHAGVIVLPETVGTFSVGGSQVPQVVTLTQSVASGSVVSSSSSQVTVRLHFDGGPFAEAKASVLLFDTQVSADTCQQHRTFCYKGFDSVTTSANQSTAHIIGPNAVSSITFPLGSSVTPGSQITARITLVRPAKAGGETVRFEVVPSTSFIAASGSGTAFSPTGTNSVLIAAGNQSKDVTVQLATLPEGCRLSCLGQFVTRMVNFTVDQAPFLRSTTFKILKQ